eukprot:GILK01007247.1.p1 GENE.GILK01007247.1~~GILK01007247.1.p1  ORF type:complete len:349 (-),score=3.81 GILK01007247.1:38-1084(-)
MGVVRAKMESFRASKRLRLLVAIAATEAERPERPLVPEGRFRLEAEYDANVRLLFRFEKTDIYRLHERLLLPHVFILDNGIRVPGIEALCVCLRRLSYPNRLFDLTKTFYRPVDVLSRCFNQVLQSIHARWKHLLLWDHARLTPDFLRACAAAVYGKGAPLQSCIGFIDGTLRPSCRPSHGQKQLFSGHKRLHGYKWQCVSTPDGILVHCHGPEPGKRHDAGIFRSSGLMKIFEEGHLNGFYLYGDPAYPLCDNLLKPFRGSAITEEQSVFNARMSAVRETVEWCFSKVLAIFAFCEYRKDLKPLLQPVALYYDVSVLLTNCHTCIYSSETAQYFSFLPPTLEEYLHH